MSRIYAILRSLFVVVLIRSSLVSHAQLSSADSLFFLDHFNETLYQDTTGYPGHWYVYSDVSSMSDLYSKLDTIFPYSNADFNLVNTSLQPASHFYYDTLLNPTFNYYYNLLGTVYGQYDPLIKLDFSLNNKSSSAYFTYSPTQVAPDSDIGFLIIPGSNQNQTTDVIKGDGYYNYNCYVKDHLQNYGDVFILCKPLEDYRALQWNQNKFNSSDYNTPGLRYVYDYLDSINRPYGTNYLIECLALLKYMNQHYKKVVVLGCSMGGYSALLAALHSAVDGAMIASGYSTHFDDVPYIQFEVAQHFQNIPSLLNDTVIKEKINHSNSEFLFSFADQDNYWFQIEHDSTLLQNFFGPLTNCSYFYNFQYHSFPPCNAIDSLLLRVIQKPKVRFTITDSSQVNQLGTEISFSGLGPVSFDLYKDGNLYLTYQGISNSQYLNLTDSGTYYIKNVINIDSTHGFCSDTILFHPLYPLTIASPQDFQELFQIQNPFHSLLRVHSKSMVYDQAEYFITNITGQVVIRGQLNKDHMELDTSSWNKGVYRFQIGTGPQRYSVQLLKE